MDIYNKKKTEEEQQIIFFQKSMWLKYEVRSNHVSNSLLIGRKSDRYQSTYDSMSVSSACSSYHQRHRHS